jgi:hypothetical protein
MDVDVFGFEQRKGRDKNLAAALDLNHSTRKNKKLLKGSKKNLAQKITGCNKLPFRQEGTQKMACFDCSINNKKGLTDRRPFGKY